MPPVVGVSVGVSSFIIAILSNFACCTTKPSKIKDFGGDNIDRYIAAYILSENSDICSSLESGNPEDRARIVSRVVLQAEKAKIDLSDKIDRANERKKKRIKIPINFELINNKNITDVYLSDDILRKILTPILSEHGEFLKPLKDSLRQANLEPENIDYVVITGGSGKFYLVREMLSKFFNRHNIIDFTEFNAVSKGAAIHSYNQNDLSELSQIEIKDIMSDNIYIKTHKGFDIIVPFDQPTGTKQKYRFHIKDPTKTLGVFLFYGATNEKEYQYKEIGGKFQTLDRIYKDEEIELEVEWTKDKIVKIFFQGKELISFQKNKTKNSELIFKFEINP